MDQQDELMELLYLLENFQIRYPSRTQNYGVHLETTRRIVETQLAELQRNEKHEQLREIDSLKQSVLRPTRTDRHTSLRSVDPGTEYSSGLTHHGSLSALEAELFIAQ